MANGSARWTRMAMMAAAARASGSGRRQALQSAGLRDDPYAQPGRPVRLPDQRQLNFRCMGHGSPTVLLEAGFGAGSNAWSAVAPRIAGVTQVCAYDRAGYGFSDPGPMPRDGAAIARDLDAGLKAAHIAGPYVVVGHSAGGLYARLFAARRIKEVVGLVFVDSSVEHQTQRLQALFGPGAGTLDGPERRPLRCLKLASAARVSLDDPEFQVARRPRTMPMRGRSRYGQRPGAPRSLNWITCSRRRRMRSIGSVACCRTSPPSC